MREKGDGGHQHLRGRVQRGLPGVGVHVALLLGRVHLQELG